MTETRPERGDDRPCDVAIVGAGPTGLLAAGLLARCGVDVRIVDKSAGPVKESRAMVVQARSLEVLLSLGLAENLLDKGAIVSGLAIVVNGKPAVEVPFDDIGRVDTPYPFPLMIPQSETEAILAADVGSHGIAVDYGVDVTGLNQDSAGAVVQARRGAQAFEIAARYVIGADGAHSIVRKTLGLSFEGGAYPQTFLLADCAVDWSFSRDKVSLFLHGREFAAYLPMRGGKLGRIIALDSATGDRSASLDAQGSTEVGLDEVQAVLRRVTGSEVTLSEPVWTSRYRVHHRGVDRYGVGRVFVAGDAAHIHSPAGGQGMNTGLQDAANLAWKLAAVLKGRAPGELLETYHAERWPIGRKVLERTDRMFSALTSLGPLASEIRNLAIPFVAGPVMRSTAARTKAFRFVSELAIRYHPNAFVVNAGPAKEPAPPSSGPRAGSRAPDARIARKTDMFDLLQGYGFTVLALSWEPLDEAAIADMSSALQDLPPRLGGLEVNAHIVGRSQIGRDPRLLVTESNEVFAAYGLGAERARRLLLVRPDGYIAFCSDHLDFDDLKAFLHRFDPGDG